MVMANEWTAAAGVVMLVKFGGGWCRHTLPIMRHEAFVGLGDDGFCYDGICPGANNKKQVG